MATEFAKLMFRCIQSLSNLTLIHLSTYVSGYRQLKDCDLLLLTPSVLQGQNDVELLKVSFTFHLKSKPQGLINNQISLISKKPAGILKAL